MAGGGEDERRKKKGLTLGSRRGRSGGRRHGVAQERKIERHDGGCVVREEGESHDGGGITISRKRGTAESTAHMAKASSGTRGSPAVVAHERELRWRRGLSNAGSDVSCERGGRRG
ncbi:hypothetical protein E2562_031829 [Oryza meyeriana var. granulata]|uniref:DUF834 domain-containing protein n=1 Tax=Oryza meyeriana var. granulata TaxID=110450 RepID=A0A6G1CVB7_9ORYZ|nr:hypothetical protein E2562_031829 [Oryza meyeriana var. granulata]